MGATKSGLGGGTGTSDVTEFTELTDAPNSYAGSAGLLVGVNNSETGLQFTNIFSSTPILVNAATTAALAANTYANGAAGVGATITINANGAFPAQDGVASVLGFRYLIKDEVDKTHNGVFALTTLGTAGTQAVLTRTTDSDTTAELSPSVAVVNSGTVNGRRYFSQQTASPTVGTDNIIYTRGFGGSGIIAQPSTQILVGTGSGISSYSGFIYDAVNGEFSVSIAGGSGGTAQFTGDASGAVGYFYMIAPGGFGINGIAGAAAALQIDSTTQGFLPPRMSTTERNTISTFNPTEGLIVYDTTLHAFFGYDNTQWIQF